MISGIVYDIEKCIYKKGIDIMKKEILLVGLGICGDPRIVSFSEETGNLGSKTFESQIYSEAL